VGVPDWAGGHIRRGRTTRSRHGWGCRIEVQGTARDQPVTAVDGPRDGDLAFGPGRLARSRAGLHTFECVVRFGGKAYHDAIPRHDPAACYRSEEYTSELQSRQY